MSIVNANKMFVFMSVGSNEICVVYLLVSNARRFGIYRHENTPYDDTVSFLCQ